MSQTLLAVENLTTRLHTPRGVLRAVDGVNFRVDEGETVCIVGESGCGKSATVMSILRLLPVHQAQITATRVGFAGDDLLRLDPQAIRRIRGRDIGMVFQDPLSALHPMYTVEWQIAEAIRAHAPVSRAEARTRVVELLRAVGIPSPETRRRAYPHQLSGGMRQRVMLAMALACKPRLLIADEPTTALDVTIQAQILNLIRSLRQQLGMAVLLITHDLGVVAQMAQRVLVMYAGQVVEEAPVQTLYQRPRHPYTEALLAAVRGTGVRKERLQVIPGAVPDLVRPPSGCRFHPRCPYAQADCVLEEPPLVAVEPEVWVRCPVRSGA